MINQRQPIIIVIQQQPLQQFIYNNFKISKSLFQHLSGFWFLFFK